MIPVNSATMRTFVFAGSLLCAAAQAHSQAPREDTTANAGPPPAHIDPNWATPPASAAAPKWQDSLPPAPPVAPREEKILPRSVSVRAVPMKAPDRRCEPGLDALFLREECGKDPSWLGQPKNSTRLPERESPNAEWMREQKQLREQSQ